MSSDELESGTPRSHSALFLVVVAVALLASLGGLIWSFTLAGRLSKSEAPLAAAQQESEKLSQELHETNARLKVATETLGQSVGLTQKQLEARAQDLLRRQKADAERL